MSYFVGQEIKLRKKIIGHSHSFIGGNDKYMILIKPGSVIEIDKPVLESIAIGEKQGDGMEECKLSNKIPMPEMVSIPKSEYELLIEIKDCFIGGNE